MKMIAPNIAKPITKPTALASEKLALRNSRSGRIGSGARASHHTNETASTAPPTKQPDDLARSQPYSLPPQRSASSRQLTAGDQQRRAEPVDGVLAAAGGTAAARGSMTTSATTPSGTLM